MPATVGLPRKSQAKQNLIVVVLTCVAAFACLVVMHVVLHGNQQPVRKLPAGILFVYRIIVCNFVAESRKEQQ